MIVCADDFGLSPDIDRAVLELVKLKRLSAVSCMVALPQFDPGAFGELLQMAEDVDIGLHLTLTEGAALSPTTSSAALCDEQGSFHSYPNLLRRCLRHQVQPTAALQEVAAQYHQFMALAGRPPDFIDGHMHVQQLPGIREGVLNYLTRLPAKTRPYVRNSAISMRKRLQLRVAMGKTSAISWFGQSFRRRALAAGLYTNRDFAGVYCYDQYHQFPDYFRRFTRRTQSVNGLIMVHPGEQDYWRRMEYDTLKSAGWLTAEINRYRRKESCPE